MRQTKRSRNLKEKLECQIKKADAGIKTVEQLFRGGSTATGDLWSAL